MVFKLTSTSISTSKTIIEKFFKFSFVDVILLVRIFENGRYQRHNFRRIFRFKTPYQQNKNLMERSGMFKDGI